MVISQNSEAIFDVLGKEYTLKGVGGHEYYLGADMKNMEEPENAFIMGSGTYIERCLTVYEQIFGKQPPKKVHSPLEPKDHPELDESDFLDEKGMHLYWKLLGMLQ